MSYLAACLQLEPRFGAPDDNRDASVAAIADAADADARLVVLPEASNAGYVFTDRDEVARWAEPVDGPTVTAWAAVAADRQVWVCGGITERDGDRLHNTAVLVGPDGLLARYRKVHLWNDEKRWYDPGDLGFPVVETPIGRLGMLICYDAWFPESFRSLALAGADVVCAPSNWVPVPGQPADEPTLARMLCQTGAHSNQVYVVAASRTGTEREQPFLGGSLIVDHTGWLVAGPASLDTPGRVLGEIDPIGSRGARRHNPFNQPLADRRPDAYA